MKKYFLLLALVPFMFISCDKNSDIEEPINRDQFVGVYSLSANGSLDVYIDSKKQTKGIDINEKDKLFKLEADNSSKTKMLVSGYFGNLSAEIKDNHLCLDAYEGNIYKDGWYDNVRIIFDRASWVGNKLSWIGVETLVSTNGKNTITAVGEVEYVAIKK